MCECDPRLRLMVHETVCVTPMGGLPVCECDPRPGVTECVTPPLAPSGVTVQGTCPETGTPDWVSCVRCRSGVPDPVCLFLCVVPACPLGAVPAWC